jgi:hypothetical protein
MKSVSFVRIIGRERMIEGKRESETANLREGGMLVKKGFSCMSFLKKWSVRGEASIFTSSIISSPTPYSDISPQ